MTTRTAGPDEHDLHRYRRGCRCPKCRKANTDYYAQWRRSHGPRDAKVHGTPATYRNYGCHCPLCTDAQAAASREWRKRPDTERRCPGWLDQGAS